MMLGQKQVSSLKRQLLQIHHFISADLASEKNSEKIVEKAQTFGDDKYLKVCAFVVPAGGDTS